MPEPTTDPSPATTPSRLRVLVLEDERDLAVAMVDTFRERGIDAWALHPRAGLPVERLVSAAAAFAPHAILCDVVMPVSTTRLVRALRRHPRLRRTRIVGCSGHALRAEAFADALDGFLHKPFDADELVSSVLELLEAPLEEKRVVPGQDEGLAGRQ